LQVLQNGHTERQWNAFDFGRAEARQSLIFDARYPETQVGFIRGGEWAGFPIIDDRRLSSCPTKKPANQIVAASFGKRKEETS